MTLTKEQQDIIEKAAREAGVKYNESLPKDFGLSPTFLENKVASFQLGFVAGNFAALSSPDLIGPVLESFSEWIRTFEALERQNGQWVIESQLSDKQIVKAFIEDLKQKDDQKAETGGV